MWKKALWETEEEKKINEEEEEYLKYKQMRENKREKTLLDDR